MNRPSVDEIKTVVHVITQEMMKAVDEPIPGFETVNIPKLESSLNTPFQSYGDNDLYSDIFTKAAALF